MSPGIYYHEYMMRSRGALNALSGRTEHRGLLLRIGDGFGCVHPWPELGDAAIEEQLERLRRSEPTPLIARAFRCAGLDALARREGRSLFAGLAIPESHAIAGDVEGVLAAAHEGFDFVKLKCGPGAAGESERLRAIDAELAREEREVRVRLDFNGTLEEDSFAPWWKGLGEGPRSRVDFVEDPFAFSAQAWVRVTREGAVRLAVDRDVAQAVDGFAVAVLKPALDDVGRLLERETAAGREVVITSYMDHPLGQMYAAYEASAARGLAGARVPACGLLSHELFERDAFIERMARVGPVLSAPEGTGLGFDEVLESIRWKRLS